MTRGHLDKNAVLRHLNALSHTVELLKAQRSNALERLNTDEMVRWGIERGLELCAQNAIDTATHIAASAGRDVVTYAKAFDVLGELGILPFDFAQTFRSVAGLRNMLVHGYVDVDLDIVADVLNRHLEDFEAFVSHVESYLKCT